MWRRRLGSATRWGLLTLTVVLVVAWVGSLWWMVGYGFSEDRNISVINGQLQLQWWAPEVGIPSIPGPGLFWERMYPDQWAPLRGRFSYFFGDGERSLTLPLWWIVFLVDVLTGVAWRKQNRPLVRRDGPNARRNRGACVSCGYDRHGLAATTVCPECGAMPGR